MIPLPVGIPGANVLFLLTQVLFFFFFQIPCLYFFHASQVCHCEIVPFDFYSRHRIGRIFTWKGFIAVSRFSCCMSFMSSMPLSLVLSSAVSDEAYFRRLKSDS